MNYEQELAIYIPEPNNISTYSNRPTSPNETTLDNSSNQSQSDPPTHRLLLPLDRVGGGQDPIGARRRTRRGASQRTPQQQARSVARRNARERKRVCLVNLGFSTLRDHIPPHLGAATSDAPPSKGRGGTGTSNNKKLSKVETLRCAIEYIKQLRDAIGYDDKDSTGSASIEEFSSSPAETSSSPSYCTSATPSPVMMLMGDSRSPQMFNDDDENDDFFNIVDWTTL